ncbi:aspartyl-phosphate phosphatase Spo0E family protein [Paenibacillus donghaensis]|uniref:Aspartyl-phosphate phosphatase Spo0E family protein n=1 Tax=Paenibacillus donghaensis TaxID=414771 RepID=A0A2Z2KK54_9BACL|nr:aspartyl-phosphate phosphatase Spo0E family protein [Paenibacillus donghaensis]ASA24595.1 hypothetical protein B9T62_29885 [Paenibacillus donghaensis]
MVHQASSRDDHRRDYREDELFLTIESLRSELLEVAQERSLSDRVVLELSERLDGYIVMAQNRMMDKLRSHKAGTASYPGSSRNHSITISQ